MGALARETDALRGTAPWRLQLGHDPDVLGGKTPGFSAQGEDPRAPIYCPTVVSPGRQEVQSINLTCARNKGGGRGFSRRDAKVRGVGNFRVGEHVQAALRSTQYLRLSLKTV